MEVHNRVFAKNFKLMSIKNFQLLHAYVCVCVCKTYIVHIYKYVYACVRVYSHAGTCVCVNYVMYDRTLGKIMTV